MLTKLTEDIGYYTVRVYGGYVCSDVKSNVNGKQANEIANFICFVAFVADICFWNF